MSTPPEEPAVPSEPPPPPAPPPPQASAPPLLGMPPGNMPPPDPAGVLREPVVRLRDDSWKEAEKNLDTEASAAPGPEVIPSAPLLPPLFAR